MDAAVALAAMGIVVIAFLAVALNDEALDRRSEAATKREMVRLRRRLAERYGNSAQRA